MISLRSSRLQFAIAYGFLAVSAGASYRGAFLKPNQYESNTRTGQDIDQTIFPVRPRRSTPPSSACFEESFSNGQLSSFKFKNFDEMLHAFRDEPVLVYFTSVTCGPCRLQKKELRDVVGADLAFKVISIDTKKWPHIGTRFAVGKLPCLLVVKDEEVLLRLEGLTLAEELLEKVYSVLL